MALWLHSPPTNSKCRAAACASTRFTWRRAHESNSRGKPKAVPAKNDIRPEQFVVVSPVTFGMPLPDSDDLRISKDKKSLITKENGWTWTLTPIMVQK